MLNFHIEMNIVNHAKIKKNYYWLRVIIHTFIAVCKIIFKSCKNIRANNESKIIQ